jgi:hypothetical protein
LFDKKNITAKYLKNIFGEIPVDLSAEIRFLRNFLRIYLRNHVSWVISCGYYCGTTCGFLQENLLWICSYFWQKIPQENFLRISQTAGNNYLQRF